MDIIERPVRRLTPLVGLLRAFDFLNIDRGAWVAGGAARAVFENEDLPPKADVDFFFPSFDANAQAYQAGRRIMRTNSFTKANKSHIIKGTLDTLASEREFTLQMVGLSFYDRLEDLFRDIDFTVAQFATDGHVVRYTPLAAQDLSDRVLRVEPDYRRHNTRPNRLLKYLAKGFTPVPGVLDWVLDLDSPKTKTVEDLRLFYDY